MSDSSFQSLDFSTNIFKDSTNAAWKDKIVPNPLFQKENTETVHVPEILDCKTTGVNNKPHFEKETDSKCLLKDVVVKKRNRNMIYPPSKIPTEPPKTLKYSKYENITSMIPTEPKINNRIAFN